MAEQQTARIMDGTVLARRVIAGASARAAEIRRRTGRRPCLATVLVGNDPASQTYVRMKRARCRQAGIASQHVTLPPTATTTDLVAAVRALSLDDGVHGILVQHPAGPHIDERAAFEAITPGKDVDGVTLTSFAAASFGAPGFVSCTPAGIMRLLDAYGVALAGKHAVVVGCSAILGRPAGMLLLSRDATVTYCHAATVGLSSILRQADVLIAGAGRPHLVRGEDIKPGAVVIDAGYHPGRIGDVDFTAAVRRASLITPVPGGVGPMTIAVLLTQTVEAASRQLGVTSA